MLRPEMAIKRAPLVPDSARSRNQSMHDVNSELPDVEQSGKPVNFLSAAILGSLAAAVLALLLFSWLAEEVFEGGTSDFDFHIRNWIHHFASPQLTKAMVGISLVG